MLKYLINILFLILPFGCFAQKTSSKTDSLARGNADSIAKQADSIINKLDSATLFIPTGLRIGTDVISIVKSFSLDDYTEYNFYADIDFYKYFFNVEYGHLERTLTNTKATYHVQGSYFRLGPDVNFLYKDPDKSALFLGVRYAFTNFSDDLDYTYDDGFYSPGSGSLSNDKLHAKWFELVAGLKVKIWKIVWLGYTARFKFGVNTFETNDLIPNQIPGYGLAEEKVTWAFNYWLIIRLPIRKAPKLNFPEK